VHQVKLHSEESRHQTGHQTGRFCFILFSVILYDFNWASCAALQQGIAVADGAPDFCFVYFNSFCFNLFYFCIMCVSQQRVTAADRAPILFYQFLYLFIYFNLFELLFA
jgi:hypothetical protein